jgi:hypothetical protein
MSSCRVDCYNGYKKYEKRCSMRKTLIVASLAALTFAGCGGRTTKAAGPKTTAAPVTATTLSPLDAMAQRDLRVSTCGRVRIAQSALAARSADEATGVLIDAAQRVPKDAEAQAVLSLDGRSVADVIASALEWCKTWGVLR